MSIKLGRVADKKTPRSVFMKEKRKKKMKRMKRNLAVLLALVISCGCFRFAYAADKPDLSFSVTAFSGARKTAVSLWQGEDHICYLFLPAYCNTEELTVRCAAAQRLKIDGIEIKDGGKTDAFTVGDHTLTVDGKTLRLRVLQSAGLPAVWLETESGSMDYIRENKNNKERETTTLADRGKIVFDGLELKSVKGRGNSTWEADKKPLNIKFAEKTDVLGMGKAKKWSLLANHFDASLLRNSLALNIAEAIGLPYTPSYRMVDLYVNGEYQGNYIIVESVEVGKTRVDITDPEEANEEANPGVDIENAKRGGVNSSTAKNSRKWVEINAPADVTGGYLLETEIMNRYSAEVSGFVTEHGQPVILKSPEYAAKKEVDYIADLFADIERALYAADGYNPKGVYYADYFDMDSLVKYYILTEYTFHRDAGQSSCYFYKDAGETVLHAGPAWDFDLSMGNTRYGGHLPFSVSDASVWWANAVFYNYEEGQVLTVFNLLYRHEDFRALVCKYWQTLCAPILSELAMLPDMIEQTVPSAIMNAFRWDLLSGDSVTEKEKAYRSAADILTDFTSDRFIALNKGFGENSAMVYYDANGGRGLLSNGMMLSVGDRVTLRNIDDKVTPVSAPAEGYLFSGWSTAKNGGKLYQPGESVELTGKTTVFYAQWKKASPASEPASDSTTEIPTTDAPATTEAPITTEAPTKNEPETTKPQFAAGDINADGRVNAADARLALRAAARLQRLSEDRIKFADMDSDGKIRSSDARIILRIAAGLRT